MCIGWKVRQEKKVRMRPVRCDLDLRVAFTTVANVWTRRCQKNLRSAEDKEWRPDTSELDNNWDPVALTFPHESPCTSRVWRFWRCHCYRWSHHSLSCHPWECQSCHWWSQDEELHLVGLSVHIEDEEDEKYVGQLKLNHSKCFWTAGSNVYFVLFITLLECEVLLCLELVEGWQEHLLMIYNQVVDTMVLLV